MSERLPLLHIVGTPSTKLVANKALLHHTLGEGKFGEFAAMSAQISAHTLQLSRSEGAGQLIDELIKVAIRHLVPSTVYLTLPTDLIHAKISSSPLNQSLPDPNSVEPRTPSPDFKPTADVEDALDKIVKAYEESVDPCVLVDACASRFGMESSVRKLVDATEMT
jgi:pyruvate decarboxylase